MKLRELLRPTRTIVLVLLALAAFASAAFAQALDTPSLNIKRAAFFRVDIDVQAGTSGAPNGFTVQWMKKADFDLYGWPADITNPIAMHANFTGAPTLNTDPRSASFQLDPDGTIQVQIGDLFDETGLNGNYLDHLHPGDYVFRAWANGSVAAGPTSAPSSVVETSTPNPECTQGFWKNHPDAWPASCLPMLLGTVSYTQAQLLAILGQPAVGNGLISLAHQLIATKLNICNGSNNVNIAATIAAADAIIGTLVVPPVGAGSLPPSSTDPLTNALDDYNNGVIPGVVACATPARHSTWSNVKALYR